VRQSVFSVRYTARPSKQFPIEKENIDTDLHKAVSKTPIIIDCKSNTYDSTTSARYRLRSKVKLKWSSNDVQNVEGAIKVREISTLQ